MQFTVKQLTAVYCTAVIILVAGLAWFRFYWLPHLSVKAFTSTAVTFQASTLENTDFPRPLKKPLLVHFISHKCPCSQYSAPYIHQLRQETARISEHVLVDDSDDISEMQYTPVKQLAKALPASPAVAIWNSQGKLTYFGPYSSGAYCGEGEDMVRYVLSALSRGEEIHWLDQEAFGCMCPWQNAS